MTRLKRFVLILTAAVMSLPLYCCSEEKEEDSVSAASEVSDAESSSASESESSSESSEEASTAEEENDSTESSSASESESSSESSEESSAAAYVQEEIPQEYDGTEINDACAKVISQYFTAIMNQEYKAYKATLDPYYFQVYNDWLDGSFGYGMETSFETMHQSLMDSAAVTNEDGTTTEVQNMTITKLTLSLPELAEGEEDMDAVIDEYLAQYDAVVGEGFTEELRKQCDDVIDVKFTMTANCDGEERDIMTDMEILMTVTDGEYHILG